MFNYLPLLDKDFKEGERGPDFFDCYGLVQQCYKLDHGVDIPDYPNHANVEKNWSEANIAAATQWVRLNRPTPHAAVTFILNGEFHVGYMLDTKPLSFIHVMRKRKVAVERLSLWKDTVDGYFQWRPLANAAHV
jgi:hypothetical protein